MGRTICAGGKRTVLIAGDGSIQMNLRELQTIIHHRLPIQLFVWNSEGYLSIRTTQRRFFEGRLIGTDNTSGVSFPDLRKITAASRRRDDGTMVSHPLENMYPFLDREELAKEMIVKLLD